MHVLLVELWAGRRLEKYSIDTVQEELVVFWQVPKEQIAAILKNTADPFVYLPPDLFQKSRTGIATQLLRGLVKLGRIRLGTYEDITSTRPGLVDRPELAEIVQRIHRRIDLETSLRQFFHDIPTSDEAAIQLDLNAWDAQIRALPEGLSSYEIQLMKELHPDEIYRDRCLRAGRDVFLSWLLEDDSLPSAIGARNQNATVPRWIHDEIITSGARSFHVNVGPHPVWLATAETAVHQAALQGLMMPGVEYGIKIDVRRDEVIIKLVLPLLLGDSGPALELPYSYSLCTVDPAWQLLHLAAVGYVRITTLRLTTDGEPLMIGTIVVILPSKVCVELEKQAIVALRRMVGEDTKQIMWRRVTDGHDREAEAAFHGNETAKSEDLHDELVPTSSHGAPAVEAFRSASLRLARARARHSTAVLNGNLDSTLSHAVEQAVEERQRALEIARADFDIQHRRDERDRAIVEALPDGQAAFVHLFIKNGWLSSVVLWRDEGNARFELLPYSDIEVDRFTAMTAVWSQQSQSHIGQDWYRYLTTLLAASTNLVESFMEVLLQQGIRRLFLSPTPPLDLLPIHAVPIKIDSTMVLRDSFDGVSYMPTARMLTAIKRSDRRRAKCPALVVAHTGNGIPGLDAIRSPLVEAEIVAALHTGARILKEESATPDAVLDAMTDARIVHITSHSLMHPNRWASGLALHGYSAGEATLTTSKILAEADLSNVDLVVLNACRTGTHDSTARTVQTLRGIESAFLARGTRAVISTLWDITALNAMAFSALLHAYLNDGATASTAYRESIAYLRHHRWRSSAHSESDRIAEALLDEVLITWRDHLDRQATTDPLFWAAFKFTGTM
ncbi:CHAT domain-containing protein [Actinomadura craniellae]|uniref:CHAT domain-containing protein n=1 Tax=Actinomadura craniellae TaxID=2231787 RepID=UPI0013149117|nr:CHAT domain-containing protein [Actinomadura craniellae]